MRSLQETQNTRKGILLDSEPLGIVTSTVPVVDPFGTMAVLLMTLKELAENQRIWNGTLLDSVPPGVTTCTVPVVALPGTVA